MNIHQILIADANKIEVSDSIKDNVASLKQYFPDSNYTLYEKKDLQEFIFNHFGDEVLWAFDYLNPYAYKADLARYCLLYILGGLYVDLRIKVINTIDLKNFNFLFFKDLPNQTNKWNNYAIQNGFLYSKEKNEVFLKSIQTIVENCKKQFYGFTPLDITGPILFGKKVAEENFYENNKKGEFGVFKYLTPELNNKNLAYVMDSGDIVALKVEKGNFSDHVKNTNTYDEMWYDKAVYGTKLEQLNSLYNMILGRDIDEDGVNSYMNIRNNQVLEILKNSEEYRTKKFIESMQK